MKTRGELNPEWRAAGVSLRFTALCKCSHSWCVKTQTRQRRQKPLRLPSIRCALKLERAQVEGAVQWTFARSVFAIELHVDGMPRRRFAVRLVDRRRTGGERELVL